MEVNVKNLEKKEDERGWLIEVLRADEIGEEIKQIYFTTIKPGKVRGNHYHKKKVDWLCVVKGKAKISVLNPANGEKKEILVNGKKPKIIKLKPGIAHAVKNIGSEDVHLIGIVNETFDPKDPDTYPLKI